MTHQWFERQLLPPRHGVSIADVVDKAGWLPSAGGTGPYLTIRARIPKATRGLALFIDGDTAEVMDVRGRAIPAKDA